MRNLFDFKGGIHPPEFKTLTHTQAIKTLTLPPKLHLSLSQSLGNPAKPCVSVGEQVFKGQIIAHAQGMVSAAIHAPTSGQITAIAPFDFAHPSGLLDLCIELTPDGKDLAQDAQYLPNWQAQDLASLRSFLQNMGVVGQGGAIFPSHLKISAPDLEELIINGAECEPFITCDDLLMQEQSLKIMQGIQIVAHFLKPKAILVGIEDNKPLAIAAMQKAALEVNSQIEVIAIPTKYPSGGAKQLIRILTGKEVPHGIRATDMGVQCFNVGTVYSIYQAVVEGRPVISRIVTLTGDVAQPSNVDALIGSPIHWLIEQAGTALDPQNTRNVIMGGPMMGTRLPSLKAGITKASNCFIVPNAEILPPRDTAMPCIRCSECATACPIELQPMDLYWFAKAKNLGKAQEWNLFDCIECGACSYVCPSQIPLVDYYRFAKSEIWSAEADKKSADKARQRHDYRQFRIEREKVEKAERLAAKNNSSATKPATALSDEKRAAIKAAMEKNQTPATENIANSKPDEKRAAIEAAMARAAAKKQASAANSEEFSTPKSGMDDEKRAAIKAAMERAAAKKQALTEGSTAKDSAIEPEVSSKPGLSDEKRAAIKAAMDKAAAKKQALAEGSAAKDSAVESEASSKPGLSDEKRAAIKAAMDKAAAKKQALAEGSAAKDSAVEPEASSKPGLSDEKRAAIKAAMDKAAAKKQNKDSL